MALHTHHLGFKEGVEEKCKGTSEELGGNWFHFFTSQGENRNKRRFRFGGGGSSCCLGVSWYGTDGGRCWSWDSKKQDKQEYFAI